MKEHEIITSAYIDLYPLKQVDSRYFCFLLHSYDVMKVFYNMGNGVRQGLNYSKFSRLMVFELPYEKEVAMADYLENKFTDVAVKAMLQIRDILLKYDKLKTSARNNTVKDFEFSYFDDIDDALIEGLEQNHGFFSAMMRLSGRYSVSLQTKYIKA